MLEEKEEKNKKNKKDDDKPNVPIKTTTDFIKMKLDKLMNNFEKPVVIPERSKSKSGPSVPEFVRNVMGSSAGAGSGEFHVYRHLRRKEYARQKFIQIKSEAEQKDEEFQNKLLENARIAKEVQAKKRAKRMKRKERKKKAKKLKTGVEDANKAASSSEQESDASDTEVCKAPQ